MIKLVSIKYSKDKDRYWIKFDLGSKEMAFSLPLPTIKKHDISLTEKDILKYNDRILIREIMPIYGFDDYNQPYFNLSIKTISGAIIIVSYILLKNTYNIPTIELNNKIYEEIPHENSSK